MSSKIKSQINFDIITSFWIVFGLVLTLIWNWIIETNQQVLLIAFSIFASYILLWFFSNRFEFYNDCFQSVYTFRIMNRTFVHQYSDIEYVKYVSTAGSKAPTIVIVFKGKKFKKLFLPSFSLTHISYKRRKLILKHLQTLGVKIEIDAVSKREKNILS